jgi:hypothetical protein
MRSDQEKTGGDAGGPGCMVLFALPFALAGVWAAVDAVRASRERAWDEAVSVGIFALAFCGVGFGLMVVSVYGTRQAARARILDAGRSGEPWPEDEDEPVGRIDSSQTQGLRGAWALALFWNLFLSPFYVAFLVELWRGSRPGLASAIVPLVGIVLIVRAGRGRRGWGRSGASTFELAGEPAAIGGRLVGRIVSDRLPPNGTSIKLRLTCLRHEGRRRLGMERLVWEAEKTVSAANVRSTGGIPVEFDIPAHCEPTSADRSSTSPIKWVLQAEAERGASFAPRFDVPVYRAPDAPAITSSEEPG